MTQGVAEIAEVSETPTLVTATLKYECRLQAGEVGIFYLETPFAGFCTPSNFEPNLEIIDGYIEKGAQCILAKINSESDYFGGVGMQ